MLRLENPLHRAISLHIKRGKFITSSGKETTIYVDLKEACTVPEHLDVISNAVLFASISIPHHKLAGIELGSVPIVACCALKSNASWILVRKHREHGTTDQIISKDRIDGYTILPVEDVCTTGKSLLYCVNQLRDNGAFVEDAITIVDREEGARELLLKNNVRLHSLVKLKDLDVL